MFSKERPTVDQLVFEEAHLGRTHFMAVIQSEAVAPASVSSCSSALKHASHVHPAKGSLFWISRLCLASPGVY